MDLLDNILHSAVQPYLRRYTAGEFLFHQGDAAETMYFLVNGRIQLLTEKGGDKVVESVLETGQFLGEKVLLQGAPYKRLFSAYCETDLLVMQVTADDVRGLEARDPGLLTDLLRTVLQVVGHRFELVNFLAQGLRPASHEARVVNVVLYFSRNCQKNEAGVREFPLSEGSVLRYVDADKKVVRATIKHLVEQGLLAKTDVNRFTVPDEDALIAFSKNPQLKAA